MILINTGTFREYPSSPFYPCSIFMPQPFLLIEQILPKIEANRPFAELSSATVNCAASLYC